MKFSIITPTHKRPAALMQAVSSVLAQAHSNWELIIINDNPGDNATASVEALNDPRITILTNEKNSGVNYSRNRGLDTISNNSDWVIFLDDDDTLAPHALSTVADITQSNASDLWIVTARGSSESNFATKAPKNKQRYSYIWDYLIKRTFKGDATHCIASKFFNNPKYHLRFPTRIKQAEEWLLYSELGTYTNFYYKPVVTTLTSDYSSTGLNLRKRTTFEQLKLIPIIIKEASRRDLYLSPAFWLYVKMRIIRTFIK